MSLKIMRRRRRRRRRGRSSIFQCKQ